MYGTTTETEIITEENDNELAESEQLSDKEIELLHKLSMSLPGLKDYGISIVQAEILAGIDPQRALECWATEYSGTDGLMLIAHEQAKRGLPTGDTLGMVKERLFNKKINLDLLYYDEDSKEYSDSVMKRLSHATDLALEIYELDPVISRDLFDTAVTEGMGLDGDSMEEDQFSIMQLVAKYAPTDPFYAQEKLDSIPNNTNRKGFLEARTALAEGFIKQGEVARALDIIHSLDPLKVNIGKVRQILNEAGKTALRSGKDINILKVPSTYIWSKISGSNQQKFYDTNYYSEVAQEALRLNNAEFAQEALSKAKVASIDIPDGEEYKALAAIELLPIQIQLDGNSALKNLAVALDSAPNAYNDRLSNSLLRALEKVSSTDPLTAYALFKKYDPKHNLLRTTENTDTYTRLISNVFSAQGEYPEKSIFNEAVRNIGLDDLKNLAVLSQYFPKETLTIIMSSAYADDEEPVEYDNSLNRDFYEDGKNLLKIAHNVGLADNEIDELLNEYSTRSIRRADLVPLPYILEQIQALPNQELLSPIILKNYLDSLIISGNSSQIKDFIISPLLPRLDVEDLESTIDSEITDEQAFLSTVGICRELQYFFKDIDASAPEDYQNKGFGYIRSLVARSLKSETSYESRIAREMLSKYDMELMNLLVETGHTEILADLNSVLLDNNETITSQIDELLKNNIESSEDAMSYEEATYGKGESKYLISYIKLIATDPPTRRMEFEKFLPNAASELYGALSAHVEKNVDLADYLLEQAQYTLMLDKKNEALIIDALSHYSVANKFLANTDNNKLFDDASIKVNLTAIFNAAKNAVENHAFDDNLVLEKDIFENNENHFKGQKIKVAGWIGRVLNGEELTAKEYTDEDLAKMDEATRERLIQENEEYSKFNKETLEYLEDIKSRVDRELEGLVDSFENNDKIPDADKEALTSESPPFNLTPFRKNLYNLVGRYIAQRVNGEIRDIYELRGQLEYDVSKLVADGLNAFENAYKIDIPLYDKLYREFDTLRDTGRQPLEVYLGRDGIYAWLGRKAQRAARMSLERNIRGGRIERSQLEAEIFPIIPSIKYLIYPRAYRDNLTNELKKEYLEQERISIDIDPIFYDTGYTGTIPENIMQVMDFDKNEIEARIRLLSAKSANRRVRGISSDSRSDIIEFIEHNAKPIEPGYYLEGRHDPAIALTRAIRPSTQQRELRPVARPTTPEEQFTYNLIRQAITRHYWIAEHEKYNGPRYKMYDTEKATIRASNNYAETLKNAEFSSDPLTYIRTHSEILKSSQGQGEFPDEDIRLVKMPDNTEVIAKRVEVRKSKDALKEFGVLVDADKVGIETAKALGFITDKDSGVSYLLMDKVEGLSGRNLQEKLLASGVFDGDEVERIMHDISKQYGEAVDEFRTKLGIDKPYWRIKDSIITLDMKTGAVTKVVPIDFERATLLDEKAKGKVEFI